jgi:hypothetical protein
MLEMHQNADNLPPEVNIKKVEVVVVVITGVIDVVAGIFEEPVDIMEEGIGDSMVGEVFLGQYLFLLFCLYLYRIRHQHLIMVQEGYGLKKGVTGFRVTTIDIAIG